MFFRIGLLISTLLVSSSCGFVLKPNPGSPYVDSTQTFWQTVGSGYFSKDGETETYLKLDKDKKTMTYIYGISQVPAVRTNPDKYPSLFDKKKNSVCFFKDVYLVDKIDTQALWFN